MLLRASVRLQLGNNAPHAPHAPQLCSRNDAVQQETKLELQLRAFFFLLLFPPALQLCCSFVHADLDGMHRSRACACLHEREPSVRCLTTRSKTKQKHKYFWIDAHAFFFYLLPERLER